MLGDLYAYIHGEREPDGKEAAVLARYRELLELAKLPVFRSGKCWDLCYCNHGSYGFDPQRHFAFLRYDDSSAWLVACNFSDASAELTVGFPKELKNVVGDRTAVRLSIPSWDSVAVRL